MKFILKCQHMYWNPVCHERSCVFKPNLVNCQIACVIVWTNSRCRVTGWSHNIYGVSVRWALGSHFILWISFPGELDISPVLVRVSNFIDVALSGWMKQYIHTSPEQDTDSLKEIPKIQIPYLLICPWVVKSLSIIACKMSRYRADSMFTPSQ